MNAVEKFSPQEAAVVPASRSTMDMVQEAVMRGASMELIEKLMALHERWEASQARKAFDAAIAAAKAEIPVIKKNRKGHNNVAYADLAAYAEVIPPIIGKHGLSHRYRANQSNNSTTVICVISHKDGYFEEIGLSAANDKSGNKNDLHALGSTLTYLQRYTLCLAFAIAAGKDDDGAASSDDTKLITEAQVDDLITLADEAKANKADFCKYMKVESFAAIPSKEFEKAKKALEIKRQKGVAHA